MLDYSYVAPDEVHFTDITTEAQRRTGTLVGSKYQGEEKELKPSAPSAAQHCLMMESFVMSVVFMRVFTVGMILTKKAKMMTFLCLLIQTYLKIANP